MKALKREGTVSGVTLGANEVGVLSTDAIAEGCKNLKSAHKLLDSWVPQAILSACYHGKSDGQTTPLDGIAKALPNSVNGRLYANWVAAFTPMWIDVKSKKAGIKKGWEADQFDLDTMADTDPFDYKPEQEVKVYDLDALLRDLLKVANGEKGKSFEVDDTTRELARSLHEMAKVVNAEVKEALAENAELDAVKIVNGKMSEAGVTHVTH
jgi:hypothetical protein